MNISKCSDEKLIKHTVAYMIKESVTDLFLKNSYYSKSSCWQSIIFSVYGVYNNKEALYLYKLWERNTRSFKTRVLSVINKINICEINAHAILTSARPAIHWSESSFEMIPMMFLPILK